MSSNMHTPRFTYLREIVSEKQQLVSGSDPYEALVFPESISDMVELIPILGHPYSNNGSAMPSIGIFHCPNNYKKKWVFRQAPFGYNCAWVREAA